MNHYRRIALMAAAAIMLAGCAELDMGMANNRQPVQASARMGPTGYNSRPDEPSDLEYLGQTVVADTHEGQQVEARGGVDIAMQWSSRYAEVAERLMVIERENHELAESKQGLEVDLGRTQDELERTQQELTEANQMLVDLHQELDSWKRDVLSFRDEMRRAQAAQLNALQKVLKVLGGEVPAEPTQAAASTSTDQRTSQ